MLATKPKVELVKIADLILDKTIQMRASLNRNAILDYHDAMKAGDEFPPIIVFYRFGQKRYVADGFHRVLAAKKLGAKTIKAEVRDGGKRDAILYAAGANMQHGVRRTNEDKRKAVIVLLKDKEWASWTDTSLARACGVSDWMVRKYREWMQPGNGSATKEEVRTYIDRAGRERTRTVPRPLEDPDLGPKVRHEKCPYCGQSMNNRN